MTESIAEKINASIDAMPASERRAAQALVANYPMLGLRTAAEFSTQAGVSAPTILRFVARLGFAGYPEFQAALTDEVAARLQSPVARSERGDTGQGADPFVEATIDNLRETFNHLSPRQADEIVSLLATSRGSVHIVGGRFTDGLARYMAAHLSIIRPASSISGSGKQSPRPADRHGTTRRAGDLRHPPLPGQPARLCRGGAQARCRHRAPDRPVALSDRAVRAPRRGRPNHRTLRLGFLASLMVVSEALIAATTRRLEETSARRIGEIETFR